MSSICWGMNKKHPVSRKDPIRNTSFIEALLISRRSSNWIIEGVDCVSAGAACVDQVAFGMAIPWHIQPVLLGIHQTCSPPSSWASLRSYTRICGQNNRTLDRFSEAFATREISRTSIQPQDFPDQHTFRSWSGWICHWRGDPPNGGSRHGLFPPLGWCSSRLIQRW